MTSIAKDALLKAIVETPTPGQRLVAVELRLPYARSSSIVLLDADKVSADVLAAVSAARIASTAISVGSSSKDCAMDLAVRRRSYVSIAAVISLSLALLFKMFKRASKASVPSTAAPSSKEAGNATGGAV